MIRSILAGRFSDANESHLAGELCGHVAVERFLL